jgi:major vault protein
MAEQGRERDLVLSPNEFVHILDETKGNINSYIGPNKASLGNTEKPVVFNERSKKFVMSGLDEAIQQFRTAPEGWYIILKNPATAGQQPESGRTETLGKLDIGRKVNMPGPASFPLWPGQMAKVVKGHHLRHNQYLLGRVYDDEAAKENWGQAVVKAQTEAPSGTEGDKGGEGGGEGGDAPPAPTPTPTPKAENALGIDAKQLTMGQLLIVKGTEVSFFIPPTGIEIVPDHEGKYARRAVTLERLEYCILLDEDGNKRFVKGPAVVFPAPTESFLRRKNEEGKVTRKFRAIELNEQMGLYIKVIAAYEEGGHQFKAGDELFLTGEEVKIYYPQPEHAIMRYGDAQEIHYAVAIPVGEGRYLLDKPSGAIDKVEGPKMLLADPRTSVIVNRILSPRMCQLMYPGNNEALQHNMALAQAAGLTGDDVERMHRESQYSSRLYSASNVAPEAQAMFAQAAMAAPPTLGTEEQTAGGMVMPDSARGGKPKRSRRRGLVADDFSRKTAFTPPRSITLNTKFQGAVGVSVWTGYAIQISSKGGERRVEVGPKNLLLGYDEDLDVFKLSRGRPKGSKGIKEEVYLRVKNNKMGDIVEAETADLVDVMMELSFRMNFEGDDPSKWFEVEDYPKYVSDHLRSMIRNAIKKVGVEEFSKNPIDLIRDTVLGAPEEGKRKGRLFEENNLRVYDVEVLNVTVGDQAISDLLRKTQQSVVRTTLEMANRERQLVTDKRIEEIQREIDGERNSTALARLDLSHSESSKVLELEIAKLEGRIEQELIGVKADLDKQETLDGISEAELARHKARKDQELELARAQLTMVLDELKANAEAFVQKAGAIQPDLVAAIQSSSDVAMLSEAYKNLAPLSVVGNKSVLDILGGMVKGTKLEGLLPLAAKQLEAPPDK